MKKVFLTLAICLLTVASQAQIVSSRSRSITTQAADYPDYQRVHINYAPVDLGGDYGKHSDYSLSGIELGYAKGTSISNTMPLYVEYGANLHYAWDSIDDEDETMTLSCLNLNVPVNLVYRYNIGNGMYLAPYAGLHARVNILATEKYEDEYYDESKTINLFDKDDVDYTAKRLQIGAQIGVGFDINNIHVGLGYVFDMTEFMKKTTTSGLRATVGFNF